MMVNNSFITAEHLIGDNGSASYDYPAYNSIEWFILDAVPGRFYSFTTDDPVFYIELYTGEGPEWSGVNYIINAWGANNDPKSVDESFIEFTAQAGVTYSIAVYPNAGDNFNLSWTSVIRKPGWSEWINPSYKSSFLARNLQEEVHDQALGLINDGSGGSVGPYITTSYPGYANCNWAVYRNWVNNAGSVTEVLPPGNNGALAGMIASPVPGWETHREWRPYTLDRLIEGVDYVMRPDRQPTDEDSYVEYEVGDNYISGWKIPDVSVDQWRAYSGYYSPSDYPEWFPNGYPIGSHLQVEINTHVPNIPPGSIPNIPVMGSGTIIADLQPGSSLTTIRNIPDPGPVPVISLFCYDPNYYVRPAGPPPKSWLISALDCPYSISGQARWLWRPQYYVGLPRFRYWIPGSTKIPPMRQRVRDDGLTIDARQMKGSGSSLQSSIRRGGRVYY